MRTTRRIFLGGAAVASLPVGAVSAKPSETNDIPVVSENPDLLAAYKRLIEARHELADAKSALEWIADEWRHRWPLAPEELLGGANAHSGAGNWGDNAERDIIGRYLHRDTAGLTQRFDRFQKQKTPRTCFSVMSVEEALERICRAEQRKPRGKTEATREKYRSDDAAHLLRCKEALELAREYHSETSRLRIAAGVDVAKERVTTADNAFYDACSEISKIPAFGPEGLQIKLEALNATGLLVRFERAEGIIGEMARFITYAMEMGGRASV